MKSAKLIGLERHRPVDQSSAYSVRYVTTSRIYDSSLGNAPTTADLLLISRLSRLSPFVELILRVFVREFTGGAPCAFLAVLEPYLLEPGREHLFIPVPNPGEDVSHEMNLAVLPTRAEEFLPDGGHGDDTVIPANLLVDRIHP